MKNKKKKIKRRRKLNRIELFKKKEQNEILVKDFCIHQAFPDPKARAEYIQALIEGLDTEPIVEN